MTEHRASFDATIKFSNGGDLTAHGFRVDVPSPDMDEDDIAALFVASLGLLMTDSVTLANVEIFAEPHKGTRGGPSDHSRGRPPAGSRLAELSHVIRAGMVTYPGLPAPEITPYLTRDASREHYAPDTEFAIDRLTLLGNTGTYLDAPYHRYPDGADLSGIPLVIHGQDSSPPPACTRTVPIYARSPSCRCPPLARQRPGHVYHRFALSTRTMSALRGNAGC